MLHKSRAHSRQRQDSGNGNLMALVCEQCYLAGVERFSTLKTVAILISDIT
jgi:hypothetical protein